MSHSTTESQKMANQLCAACHEPLVIEIEPDSDLEDSKDPAGVEFIPDDVELSCGCHFHWECFLEAYTITKCPSCSKDISSLSFAGEQQVLCTVRNEGGVREGFDILPSATEEGYFRTYPEERKGHAYLEFCREGDIDAIIHLIKDEDDQDAQIDDDHLDILRYQGTFEGIEGSGLHVAIRYGRENVAWLLMALGSSLDWSTFPPAVLQAIKSLGLSKQDKVGGVDVRSLKDNAGRTAEVLAEEVGGAWTTWLKDGRFRVP